MHILRTSQALRRVAADDMHLRWCLQLTNNVGTLASLYTASYYGQNITGGDTFRALNCQSQAFCVGVTVDALGNAILVGGDNQCVGCLFRSAAEKAANIPYPNGYYDVRRFAPGAARPSFAELLSVSLSQESELRAWISENLGYQQARMDGLSSGY